jgi:hypothetical protein
MFRKTRHFPTALLVSVLVVGCAKSWTPPEHPDPQEILQEAESDARAGNYAEALAKQVWFFQNALKYEPAEYGVRLSFALSDWVELGKDYPPALDKLRTFRDEAGKNVRNGEKVRDNFADFESINKELMEDSKTVDLFIWLDSNKPDSAKMVYDLARPALIKAKQYALLGEYIQSPIDEYNKAFQVYERNMQEAKNPELGDRMRDFGEHRFKNETATLIAILVVTDRKAAAEKIAENIEKQRLPEDTNKINKALSGEVPPPWP